MYPELFTLPFLGVSVKTYGFCLMIGFLTAVWMAMRRAERVKASAETVLDLSFFALMLGVAGARIFYVYHYWQSQFAVVRNPMLAALDITKGGLEFLGGLLGGILGILACLLWKKQSMRLYLDIMAPGAMWGLAIGRVGCFFNGCCFGGICVHAPDGRPLYSWAAPFPFASPVHWRQWEDREVTVPAELIVAVKGDLQPVLLPASMLTMPVEKRDGPARRHADASKAYELAKEESADPAELSRLKIVMDAAAKAKTKHERELAPLLFAQRFPSRNAPTRVTSVSELEQLASQSSSLPIHPVQLYSAINAFLLSGLLSTLFQVRKRHGVVFGTTLVLYPIGRFILEMIRTDNPHDVAGLTVSQFVCVGMFITGVVYLAVLYLVFPERSPALANEPAPRSPVEAQS